MPHPAIPITACSLLFSGLTLVAGIVIGREKNSHKSDSKYSTPPESPFAQNNKPRKKKPKARAHASLWGPSAYLAPLIPLACLLLVVVALIYVREDLTAGLRDLVCGLLVACAITFGKQARQKTRGLQRQLSQKAPPSIHYHPILGLNGVWFKAPEYESKESAYESRRACDLLQLNGIVRIAVCLIKGVEFKITGVGDEHSTLEMAAFSVITWFKVIERWPMSGVPIPAKRRDLRQGKMTGSCKIVDGTAIELNMWWGEPFAGRGRDFFRLVSPDELHVTTTLWVANEEHSYTTIHRRG